MTWHSRVNQGNSRQFKNGLKMCLQIVDEHSTLLLSAKRSTKESIMAHIVTSKCVGCKFTDCVEVCPVACFYELDNQLLIHPDDCIDCTACVAECPVEAIYAEGDLPADYQANIEFNATEARRVKDAGQAAIVKKKDPLPTAAQRKADLGY